MSKSRNDGMSKSKFRQHAKLSQSVSIGGSSLLAGRKEFSTGSVGYYTSGKLSLPMEDGTIVEYQIGVTLTAIGSKEWSEGTTTNTSANKSTEEQLAEANAETARLKALLAGANGHKEVLTATR